MPTLLIVDSDPSSRSMLKGAILADPRLVGLGLAIEVADDAASALASFRLERPKLTVITLMLADEPGDVLAAALRRDRATTDARVVFVSNASIDRGEQERLRRMFHARHFTTPDELANLVDHIAEAVVGDGERESASQVVAATAEQAGQATEEVGNLATRPVPAVLFDLLEASASGRLTLRRGKVTKEAVLIAGKPHSVSSNLRSETLGHFLVARRVIDADQHAAAIALAAETGERLGQALVALGLLGPEQLLVELGSQARFKLERALRWQDGEWRFLPHAPTTGPHGEPIDVFATVLDGLRSTLAFDPLPAHLADAAGRALRVRSRGVRLIGELAERCPAFASRCRDGETIETLVAAGVDRAEVLAALDALLLSDGLALDPAVAFNQAAAPKEMPVAPSIDALNRAGRISSGPPIAAPTSTSTADDSGMLHVMQASRARLDPEAQSTREAVVAEYLRVLDVDLYAVLDIPRDADAVLIAAATDRKLSTFTATGLETVREPPRERGMADELTALFRRAGDVLGDADSRRAYDASLRPAGPPAGSVAPMSPMRIELEVRAAATDVAAGRLDAAIDRLEQVIETSPSEASYRAMLAAVLWQRSPDDATAQAAALGHLDQALALDPDLAAALETRGAILSATGDPAGVADLSRALELDPARPTALAALEHALRRTGELATLERVYRQLLYRLELRDAQFTIDVWGRLAALYRDDFGDLDLAQAALAAAIELAPGDAGLRAALADAERGTTARFHQRALALRRRLVDDGELDAGLRLIDAADAAGEPDSAFVTAAVLAVWESICPKTASPVRYDGEILAAVRERHERHRPRAVRRASQPLARSLWRRLHHAADTPALGRLFAALSGPAVAAWPITLADLDAGAPATDQELPAALIEARDRAGHLLGEIPPPVVVYPPLGGDVATAAVVPPVLLVGDAALAAGPVELAFRIGRAMSYLAPGRTLAGAFPSHMLKQMVLAAHLSAQGLGAEGAAPELAPLMVAINDLAPDARTELVSSLLALTRQQRTLDLSGWVRALAATADRVGLLICGDPAIALRVVESTRGEASARELADFALGPDHLSLRTLLGLTFSPA